MAFLRYEQSKQGQASEVSPVIGVVNPAPLDCICGFDCNVTQGKYTVRYVSDTCAAVHHASFQSTLGSCKVYMRV